jgi:hypothetical protein
MREGHPIAREVIPLRLPRAPTSAVAALAADFDTLFRRPTGYAALDARIAFFQDHCARACHIPLLADPIRQRTVQAAVLLPATA